jgi:PAS domain S-box-containing protein
MNFAEAPGIVSIQPEPGAQLSLDFLKRVIDDAPAGMLITRGPEHRVEYANRAFGGLCGLGSITVGRPVTQAVPDFAKEVSALLDRVYVTRHPASSSDQELALRGGGFRYVRCKAWPRPDVDDGIRGLVLLAQDVTPYAAARRCLEHLTDELRAVNERFVVASVREHESAEIAARQVAQISGLLANLSDGIIVVDDAGRLVLMNRVARDVLGPVADRLKSIDDLRQLNVMALDGTPIPFADRPLARALRGERVEMLECLLGRADGRRRRLSISASSIPSRRDDDGRRRAICVFRDVTELRRLEAIREASLERSRHSPTIGEMATGIAHDLRNLLNPLSLQLSVVGEALELGDTERGRRAIQQTRSVLHRAVEALARLDDFAARRPEAQTSPVDLAELAREAVLIAKPRLLPGMQRIVEELGPVEPIDGYASDIVRAIVNLICNAIDSIQGRGTVRLRSGADADGGWIEVGDDGSGMTPEVQRRAFEPFFTTKGKRGTGMGLVMVKECMDRHQGHAKVETTPGHGTRVRLWFPLSEAAEPVSEVRRARRVGSGTRKKQSTSR